MGRMHKTGGLLRQDSSWKLAGLAANVPGLRLATARGSVAVLMRVRPLALARRGRGGAPAAIGLAWLRLPAAFLRTARATLTPLGSRWRVARSGSTRAGLSRPVPARDPQA